MKPVVLGQVAEWALGAQAQVEPVGSEAGVESGSAELELAVAVGLALVGLVGLALVVSVREAQAAVGLARGEQVVPVEPANRKPTA